MNRLSVTVRRLTFSRNYTLSLSRTCRCYCKYCSFATHRPHLHSPDEVQEHLDEAVRRNCKELLLLTGEAPDSHPDVKDRLSRYGHRDFVSYVIWVCERALERGLLPHSNIGVISEGDLARLREVNASMGLMLESVSERLMGTVHAGSPTKHPAVRLASIEAAGRLKIPFTSGILVGIGETEQERLDSLEALAELNDRYGHIQEVILQNYVPHPAYYGREVGEIADNAALDRWRWGDGGGVTDAVARRPADDGGELIPAALSEANRTVESPRVPLESVVAESGSPPDWAMPVTLDEYFRLVRGCRRLMPEVGIQVPPNLSRWWPELVDAGATDLGGLSANGDHISPEHPFPSPHEVRKLMTPRGYALTERLCVYPRYLNAEWVAQGVLDTIRLKYWSFIPRQGSGRRRARSAPVEVAGRAIERGRSGERLSREEAALLLSEQRPEVIEEMRAAADELRAELAGPTVTYVINRNINFTNICVVGCAFCGFGQGRRSPDAYEISDGELVAKVREAVDAGATEICMQGGIHPGHTLADYGRWLSLVKDVAPEMHIHAYSPMEVHFMCERSGKTPAEVFDYLIGNGLGSIPGTAAEVLHDGVRRRISPNKLPVARWVEIVEAAHRMGLRSTVTVMFGHIEEPEELAEHMHVVCSLQERTGGFTEFVPLPFVPYHTLLGRTHGVEEISSEENLKFSAAFRLVLGRSIVNLQASWVKMGLEAASESLRWGVNDLGGTLMEESISRMAGSSHGVRRDPEELVAAAHAAGRPAAQRDTLYGIVKDHGYSGESAGVAGPLARTL